MSPVHPRACGGSVDPPHAPNCSGGPSPRVRGKRFVATPDNPGKRSIPARAGEAFIPYGINRFIRVHPRACGGSSRAARGNRRDRGPSPRVRGKRSCGLRSPEVSGSIPARAGEAVSAGGARPEDGVHPRACGGSSSCSSWTEKGGGPSPRVRGKLPVGDELDGLGGSIPARAGEAVPDGTDAVDARVHPRACGGSSRAGGGRISYSGPSPRVRGKHAGERSKEHPDGSIPARAGEADLDAAAGRLLRVHPRACGGSFRTR